MRLAQVLHETPPAETLPPDFDVSPVSMDFPQDSSLSTGESFGELPDFGITRGKYSTVVTALVTRLGGG